MIHSVCLECPATKAEEKIDLSQIKVSQDTKPSNHNSDMIEAPIIKEQEVLPLRRFAEPISYPEDSTLHNNSRNSLETSSAKNDLISDSEIKQQTQDITNLQDVCSIEDISSEKAPLEDREMDAFLDEEYKKKVSNEIRQRNREKKLRDLDLPGTSDIPSDNTSSEQNSKIKAPEMDIQPLIQELLIEPSKEDCVKIVNVGESPAVDQSPAIELAHLFQKMKFAEIRTKRAKQDEIMSWYCYRKYFEKRHSEILPGILKNGLITNKKAYELASGQIYDEMLQYLSGVSPEVPAFSQPNKTVTPYDARAPYINVALKEYPYLSLFNSDRHNDGYEFKNSGLCPGCEKEHDKGKVVGRCIKGSYYIKCRSSPHEKEIKINALPEMISSDMSQANVPSASQSKPIYDRSYFRNKTLDQYPNLYREFKHDEEESLEGRYKAGSYFIKCEQHEIEIVA
ncbi:hypothetical protein RhiirC2_798896 [Rhizophagus irregularis]|uniref:Uncharacterized protein n=1 Tax=Rhizophagus irregularis TaxID=588596 RepID=A0A2N1M5R8_9GLOM|nr:hypothetical protein RhiirC2_798896 [Rhizophagus irregularis]